MATSTIKSLNDYKVKYADITVEFSANGNAIIEYPTGTIWRPATRCVISAFCFTDDTCAVPIDYRSGTYGQIWGIRCTSNASPFGPVTGNQTVRVYYIDI